MITTEGEIFTKTVGVGRRGLSERVWKAVIGMCIGVRITACGMKAISVAVMGKVRWLDSNLAVKGFLRVQAPVRNG
jgi:hypothetical protein